MLSDFEQRYARHLCLKEVGEIGQQKLLDAKVLVVGAGGIGCPLILYLAASGVGEIGVIDNDKVELSNLSRQILFETLDVGLSKVMAAKTAINDLNPNTKITIYNKYLNKENCSEIISKYNLILDASDNIETRYLINQECFKAKKTLISAACEQFTAHFYTFRYEKDEACYNCLFPNLTENDTLAFSCAQNGIFSPIAGLAGVMQAHIALKEIIGIGKEDKNFILFNGLKNEFKKMKIQKDKSCSVCGEN